VNSTLLTEPEEL